METLDVFTNLCTDLRYYDKHVYYGYIYDIVSDMIYLHWLIARISFDRFCVLIIHNNIDYFS